MAQLPISPEDVPEWQTTTCLVCRKVKVFITEVEIDNGQRTIYSLPCDRCQAEEEKRHNELEVEVAAKDLRRRLGAATNYFAASVARW